MVELVDTLDLDSSAREGVRVRVSVGALGMCKHFLDPCLCMPYTLSLWLLMGDSVQSKILGAGLIKAGTLTAQSKVGRKKLRNDT